METLPITISRAGRSSDAVRCARCFPPEHTESGANRTDADVLGGNIPKAFMTTHAFVRAHPPLSIAAIGAATR